MHANCNDDTGGISVAIDIAAAADFRRTAGILNGPNKCLHRIGHNADFTQEGMIAPDRVNTDTVIQDRLANLGKVIPDPRFTGKIPANFFNTFTRTARRRPGIDQHDMVFGGVVTDINPVLRKNNRLLL